MLAEMLSRKVVLLPFAQTVYKVWLDSAHGILLPLTIKPCKLLL